MHIGIVAFRRLVTESRLIRQVRTFLNLGCRVTVAGFVEPGDTFETGAEILPLPRIPERRSWMRLQTLARLLLPARLAWRLHPQHRAARNALLEKLGDADILIGHDWITAPLLSELSERHHIEFCIDAHEYAKEEFAPTGRRLRDFGIRHAHHKHADAIQREYFPKAKGITTVCDGIADLLQQDYSLAERPGVVRSTPFYEKRDFRPCGDAIRILYHGAVSKERGIDQLIRAVPLLDARFVVEVRGPDEEDHLQELKDLAAALGVQNRVLFTDVVPFARIVSEAAKADIGYFVPQQYSAQSRFCLPNKFFENTMAGLALCVSSEAEKELIARYNNGIYIDECAPEAIARKINSLTAERINAMKRASLEAAKTLCWEQEEKRMLKSYGLDCLCAN